ncbi:MAG: hypothetical protein ACT4NY_12395 [Pseudonocardiales bacterium]
MGATDGLALGLKLLRDALARRDPVDVEMALIVADVFGVTDDYLESLVALASKDWHFKHEDVVTLLGRLRSPEAVDALYEAAQWVPEYLDFDENRALANKAVRALGAISVEGAEKALKRLLSSDAEVIRNQAAAQLDRRREP